MNKILTESLSSDDKIEILGPIEPELRGGIFSFNVKGLKSLDVAKMLDSSDKIMVRGGMHCVHSWFNSRNLDGSVRVSLYIYNTEKEIEEFVKNIKKIILLAK